MPPGLLTPLDDDGGIEAFVVVDGVHHADVEAGVVGVHHAEVVAGLEVVGLFEGCQDLDVVKCPPSSNPVVTSGGLGVEMGGGLWQFPLDTFPTPLRALPTVFIKGLGPLQHLFMKSSESMK